MRQEDLFPRVEAVAGELGAVRVMCTWRVRRGAGRAACNVLVWKPGFHWPTPPCTWGPSAAGSRPTGTEFSRETRLAPQAASCLGPVTRTMGQASPSAHPDCS